jgi:hypothetical protein
MEDWNRETGAPIVCARSWSQLTRLFGDVADGVRVRLQFRADVFGRDVLLWGDFLGWEIDATGALFVVVSPVFGDDDDVSEDMSVPFLAVCDWVVN